MEKLKNFIYDKSDLLVALLIIAVAALIIWFGINNIMEPYTQKADAKTSQQTEQPVSNDNPVVQPEQQTTPAAEAPKDPEVTKKTAKIIIQPGENSDQIADKLIAAGAITDKNTFYAKLDELGIASKIQEGSFEIPAGSSLEVVCRIITKTN